MPPLCFNASRCGHAFRVEVCQLDDEMDELAYFSSLHAAAYSNRFLNKTRRHNSALSGHCWMQELWAGKEGSMHDSRILMEAMRSSRRPLPFAPTGKYYLADSGFP